MAPKGAMGAMHPRAGRLAPWEPDTACHRLHGFVNGIILLPKFGPARAALACDIRIVTSATGPVRAPDSSAPQPPGVRTDRCCCFVYGSIPQCFGAGFAPALFFAQGAHGRTKVRRASVAGAPRRRRCRHAPNLSDEMRRYCSVAVAAPSIAPGTPDLPVCTSTATESASSPLMSAIGRLQVSALPLHVPSLTQRRTTL